MTIVQFTVAQMAQEYAITTRAVRLYEETGLLHPIIVSGKHYYTSEDTKKLGEIIRMKRLGFTLKEIKELKGFDVQNKHIQVETILSLKEISLKLKECEKRRDSIELALKELRMILSLREHT